MFGEFSNLKKLNKETILGFVYKENKQQKRWWQIKNQILVNSVQSLRSQIQREKKSQSEKDKEIYYLIEKLMCIFENTLKSDFSEDFQGANCTTLFVIPVHY